jgi:hypothetical protein
MSRRPRRRPPLKLHAALFGVCRLFNRNRLALHLGEFDGILLVAANKERGWPKDHDRRHATLN